MYGSNLPTNVSVQMLTQLKKENSVHMFTVRAYVH